VAGRPAGSERVRTAAEREVNAVVMQIVLWGLVVLFGVLWFMRYSSRKKARQR
jgi:hypothetical protein